MEPGRSVISTVPELLLTLQEYLAREGQAGFPSEFYRGEKLPDDGNR